MLLGGHPAGPIGPQLQARLIVPICRITCRPSTRITKGSHLAGLRCRVDERSEPVANWTTYHGVENDDQPVLQHGRTASSGGNAQEAVSASSIHQGDDSLPLIESTLVANATENGNVSIAGSTASAVHLSLPKQEYTLPPAHGTDTSIEVTPAAVDCLSTTAAARSSLFPGTLPSIPWDWATTLVLVACWLTGFYTLAYGVVPLSLEFLGLNPASPAPAVQAVRHLALDLAQLAYTVALLWRGLQHLRPRERGLFRIALRPIGTWLPHVLAGASLFPLVHAVHKLSVVVLSPHLTPPASGEAAAKALLGSGGLSTRLVWLGMLAVCAPVWEELMFRGFLLPSLGTYLPSKAAVLATAAVFACVHFSLENFLPLMLLGWIFGAAYRHSKANLLPCIVLHSLWNVYLLVTVCGF